MIQKEWLTQEFRAKTNEQGKVEVSGFRGVYTAVYDGGSMEFEI